MSGKVLVTGLEDDFDVPTYGSASDGDHDFIGLVHVVETAGSGEAALCGLDLVTGAICKPTRGPVTCETCRRALLDLKRVRVGYTPKLKDRP